MCELWHSSKIGEQRRTGGEGGWKTNYWQYWVLRVENSKAFVGATGRWAQDTSARRDGTQAQYVHRLLVLSAVRQLSCTL